MRLAQEDDPTFVAKNKLGEKEWARHAELGNIFLLEVFQQVATTLTLLRSPRWKRGFLNGPR